MGVRVREKPKESGIYWVFINHNGKRKSKKIGADEKLANEVAEKIKAKLVLGELNIEKQKTPTLLSKSMLNYGFPYPMTGKCQPENLISLI